MGEIAIQVERLGKKYRIGTPQVPYRTLRDAVMGVLTRSLRRFQNSTSSKANAEILWALRNVSFEIKHGQVLGIIGRNGAGKTTLLKILSHITEPTEGRAILHGRVGSLLEVGTGFHPELTGRENIYLNGAILGMKRSEIVCKFDEIVAFAEVEKFVDTPVKHYSSGMYVRLAFAVAAHLDPDILLVDEVLAVGDASFQKKCLGKMGNVAREGRTIFFVSHNMGAIASLCNRCLLIDRGVVIEDGKASAVVSQYQSTLYPRIEDPSDLSKAEHYGTGKARFISLKLTPMAIDGTSQTCLHPGEDLKVELKIRAEAEIVQTNVALTIYDAYGHRLIDANTALQGAFMSLKPGQETSVEFLLQNVLLKPGTYLLGLWLGRGSFEDIDGITYAGFVAVEPNPQDIMHSETFPGVYQCKFTHVMEVLSMSKVALVDGNI